MKTIKTVLSAVLAIGILLSMTACSGPGAAAGVPEFKLFYYGLAPFNSLYETTVEIALDSGEVMYFDFYDDSDSIAIDSGSYDLSTPNLERTFIWSGAEFEGDFLKSVIVVDSVADSLYTSADEFTADFNNVVPGSYTKITGGAVTVTSTVSGDETAYTFTWSFNSGAIAGTYSGVPEEENLSVSR